MSDLLVINNVKKHFGEVKAVDNVGFKMEEGKITSIIGSNGAGKTTLFNIISKMLFPDDGTILFKGEDITRLSPVKVIEKGLVKSFQISSMFEDLTVFECIRIAVVSLKKRNVDLFSLIDRSKDIEEKVFEVLETFELLDRTWTVTKELPHGDRKVLDVAIAFALEPKLLLLDEPTSGMSSVEKRGTIELIYKLQRDSGVTISLIEHDIDLIFSMSDNIIVMHEGKILAKGPPEKITDNSLVREVYFGETAFTA